MLQIHSWTYNSNIKNIFLILYYDNNINISIITLNHRFKFCHLLLKAAHLFFESWQILKVENLELSPILRV
jgi:hypothetical protein